MQIRKLNGFSLVELSIVLVILGLLVGGVLSGQSLIRASELRAVTAEYGRYFAAEEAFRDKYFQIPGDFNNATAFWGKDNTYCSGNTGTAATPGTCNGDGNGNLDIGAGGSVTGEKFQFWKQLALAGLIEGSYSGIAGPAAANDAVISANVPKSHMSSGGWSASNFDNSAGATTNDYTYNFGNDLIFGAQLSGGATKASILKPEEAWNIDTKLDDGKPGSGKIMAHEGTAFATATSCTSAASGADFTSGYNLTNATLACALNFPRQF